uniref:J domain-containing protein n=1 Tax=Meloidogyne javanica TaxID=6303 RepID=A0A915MQA3_MELJA
MNAALPDLDRVVELKPDFISGRLQRGNIYYKQGNLDRASDDYTFALRHDSENSEVKDKLKMIDQIREWVKSGNYYHENGDHDSAERVLSYALEHCNWDADLHRKRGKIRLARGDTQNAISDIRAVAKLVPDSTEVYLEISRIYYETGDAENAMTQIRECLHLNPEHPLYLDNSIQKERWAECLDKSTSILKFEQDVDRIQLDTYKQRCKCNVKLGHVAEAIQECTEVLKYVDENDWEVLLNRGEAYLLNEDYDSAVEDFQKAVKANEDSRQAKEALNRALKLQKQAKKRDYYKILGWHPDNFQDDAEKKRAQEKFILIAAAKDVLTDPEKRRIFDSGEDPMDPQGGGGGHHGFQQWQWSGGQGGFPFGEGFNPFGDDGGQYSFKFNFG